MEIFEYQKKGGTLPPYGEVLNRLNAFMSLDKVFHARFVDVWSTYLEYLDDPNADEYRRYNAERIIAKIKGREPPAPPAGYKSPGGDLPAGPKPSEEQTKVIIALDGIIMKGPWSFVKGVVGIIRNCDAATALSDSNRSAYLDNKLRKVYDNI